MTDAAASRIAPTATIAPTRAFYWSVRRELWEHRSIYLGPLIAAGLVLFGFILAALRTPHVQMNFDSGGRPAIFAVLPYVIVAGVVLGAAVLVAFAYCLGALNNERKDRSILFWKSLPVSDLITVLSKASVPTVVIPLISFVVILASELVVVILGALTQFHPTGMSSGDVFNFVAGTTIYGTLVLGLWYAPVYGWLLLVSSWAKRGAFLWAILPPIGLCVLEGIIFHSKHFADLLGMRLNGGFAAAFAMSAPNGVERAGLPHITREQFFTSPDLWVGLLVAAGFVAAAVWMRRRAEPV